MLPWLPASNSSPSATATRAPGSGLGRAYVATREEIAARYAEWEITGPAEVRDVDPAARYFTPHRRELGNLGPVITIARLSRLVAIAGVTR